MFAYTHTHAVETFIFGFFTKQVSATYAPEMYLHWTEKCWKSL